MSSTILLGTLRMLLWVAAFWLLLRKADARKPATAHGDGRIEFARNEYAYLAWAVMTGVFAWGAIKDLLFGKRQPLALVSGAGLALMAAMLLVEFPGTIVITGEGIEQFYWLRRNKYIHWKDIVEINTGEKTYTVAITAADGTRIVHSAQLPDRERLLLELKRHCGENLPPEFPSEPLVESRP